MKMIGNGFTANTMIREKKAPLLASPSHEPEMRETRDGSIDSGFDS
jgi:hypothetical protein